MENCDKIGKEFGGQKMKKKIIITHVEQTEEELLMVAESGCPVVELKPKEQMLVDSDNLSFIYILDYVDDYIYLAIPDSFWPDIKKALDLNLPIYLSNQKERLLLTGMLEELNYLIDNIKGNSNYGEIMVEKVENIF